MNIEWGRLALALTMLIVCLVGGAIGLFIWAVALYQVIILPLLQ